MNDDVITDTATAVTQLQEGGSQPANLVPIRGGREVGVMERSIEFALRNNVPIEQLQQLLQMKERIEETEARRAFVESMAKFKLEPPEILKTKLVEFETKNNGKTSYMHEQLGEICELIVKGLAEVGISHRWKPHRESGQVGISCVLTHRMGHEQDDGPLWASADTSGGKNSIQAMASSTKYLERYTLLMATGLAPKSMVDDDGRGHVDAPVLDWAEVFADEIRAAGAAKDLVAAWKIAAGACRRKKDLDAHGYLQQLVRTRCDELQITPDMWAAGGGGESKS